MRLKKFKEFISESLKKEEDTSAEIDNDPDDLKDKLDSRDKYSEKLNKKVPIKLPNWTTY